MSLPNIDLTGYKIELYRTELHYYLLVYVASLDSLSYCDEYLNTIIYVDIKLKELLFNYTVFNYIDYFISVSKSKLITELNKCNYTNTLEYLLYLDRNNRHLKLSTNRLIDKAIEEYVFRS